MDALLDALAVLFPVSCAGCGAPDRAVCDRCGMLLGGRVEQELGGLPVVSAAVYEGAVRRMLLAFKDEGRTDVAAALARGLARHLPDGLELAPVPASAASTRRRGYEPVRVLAARLGQRPPRLLRLVHDAGPQKLLGVAERGAHRSGSMRAASAAAGRRLLLLDDVVTTGATLVEAARALREAGAEVVGAVTVAATPRRSMAAQPPRTTAARRES